MPRTLLLADDSVVIQKLVGLSFANEDVELITVDNGDDAIERARAARPDLVLADVVMPGQSGYDVCQAIKAVPGMAHTPVLLLTGTFEAFDEDRARQVGADGHITKPFEAQALVERVKTVLDRAATPSEDPDDTTQTDASFDVFDDAPVLRGSAPAPMIQALDETPALAPDDDPLAELMLDTEEEDAALLPEASFAELDGPDVPEAGGLDVSSPVAASSADPAATMVVNDLFDEAPDTSAPLADDASDSYADLTGPNDDDFEFAAAPLGEDDLFGGNDATNDELTLETETDPALDIDLEMETAAQEPLAVAPPSSATPPPDATVAIFPEESSQPDTAALLEETAARMLAEPADDRFDISSSDLDDAMTVVPPPAAASPEAAAPVPDAQEDPLAVFRAPLDAGEGAFSPPTTANPMAFAESVEPAATVLAPLPAVEEPAAAAPVAPVAPIAEPAPGTPAPAAAAAPAAAVQLDDEMRQQIHEALEKVAWEAFSDVSQTLVRQTLEMVERIAWEVVPQMAERLIEEEIRRLKGDS